MFFTALSYDPCYNYTVLDDLRRATSNQLQSSYYAQYTPKLLCDRDVNWVGWYRLFIRGQSVQMPDTCVDQLSCGTHAPLWMNGSHPQIEDGVVTRSVCGHWLNNCCFFKSNPIKVKACPGGYYVYEFVRAVNCYLAYCAGKHISICVKYYIYEFVRSVCFWHTVEVKTLTFAFCTYAVDLWSFSSPPHRC